MLLVEIIMVIDEMRCKIDDDQDNEADDESRRPGRASSCTRSIPTAKRMGSENCGCVVKPRSENCPVQPVQPVRHSQP